MLTVFGLNENKGKRGISILVLIYITLNNLKDTIVLLVKMYSENLWMSPNEYIIISIPIRGKMRQIRPEFLSAKNNPTSG